MTEQDIYVCILMSCRYGKNLKVQRFYTLLQKEKSLQELKSLSPKKYVQSDYFTGGYKYNRNEVIHMNVCDIDSPNESFDVVICNHVLEHVQDDKKAMKEIYRVLKKRGIAILQTPFSSLLRNTFEDPNINTDELRSFFLWST